MILFFYELFRLDLIKSSTELTEPCQTLIRTHGKTEITDICEHCGYVYTCGRDGIYRQYELMQGKLELINEFRVSQK